MKSFAELLAPYGENGRTIGGQIGWLAKNGCPQQSIDYAITKVYAEIDGGRIFENGHELDQELRRVANEHHAQELEEQMRQRVEGIAKNLDAEWVSLTKWQKIKQVLLG